MKTFLCIFLAFSFGLFAVEVDTNKRDRFEGDYGRFFYSKLESKKSVVLDCQSFFHKLDFYHKDRLIKEFYIDQGECHFIYSNTKQCFSKKGHYCFDSKDIFKKDCHCSE